MNIALAILSGIILSLSCQNVFGSLHFRNLGMLAWIGFVPLFYLVSRLESGVAVFRFSFLSFGIYFAVSLYWLVVAMTTFGGLSPLTSMGVLLLLVVMQAAITASSVALSFFVSRQLKLSFFLIIPLVWCCLEWLRNYFPFGGFPWSNVAMSQAAYLPIIQIADMFGAYGVGFSILVVNSWLAYLICRPLDARWKEVSYATLGVGVLLGMQLGYGYFRLENVVAAGEKNQAINVSLLQPNISQDEKWNHQMAQKHLSHLLTLAKQSFPYVNLTIWPEASYPFVVDPNELFVSVIPRETRKKIPFQLIGALSIDSSSDLHYNSALLVDPEGVVLDIYHKIHLVPFGEYVPFRRFLFFAKQLTNVVGEMNRGRQLNPLAMGSAKIGTLICYEDIFPEIARMMSQKGANVLVNMTNDAWYGRTSAAYQHAAMSVYRAVENRRYLLRATNTGVSMVVDPVGRPILTAPLFEPALIIARIHLMDEKSLYTRIGDGFAYILCGITVALLLASCYKR